MKILKSLSMAFVIVLAGCNLSIGASGVKGSGIMKTEKRSLAPFDSIEASFHGSIQAHTQGREGLEISGDDNITPLITTEVNNGILYIRSSKEYKSDKLEINVSAHDIKKFV